MANKRTPNYDKWVKSFSKMAGTTTKGVLKTLAPSMAETAGSFTESLRDARSHFKSMSSNRNGRSALDVLNSAYGDIRSGSYALKNLSDDSYDDAINLDDIVTNDDPSQNDAGKHTAAISKTVAEGNAATIEGLRHMTETLSNVTLKSSSASADRFENVALYGISKLSADMTGVHKSLNNINTNIASLLNFHNQNTNLVHKATLEYYNKTTSMLYRIGENLSAIKDTQEEMKKMATSKKGDRFGFSKPGQNIFGFSGGFDFKEYSKFAKSNFDNSLFGTLLSMSSMMGGMGSGKGRGVLGRTVGGITDMFGYDLLSMLVPGSIRKSTKSMDKNFSRYMKNILYRIGDMGSYSNTNPITQFLGELFGVKRPSTKRVNMADFHKGDMQWNGLAQKSLVEVIPGYLASIESILRKQEQRFYDMDRGVFRTKGQISKQYSDEYKSKTEFGMMQVADKILKQLEKSNKSVTEKEITTKYLDQIIHDRIEGKRGNDKSYHRDMDALLKGLPKNEIRDIMLELEDSIRDTIGSINEFNRSIENDVSGSVYRNLFNTGSVPKARRADIFNRQNQFSKSGKRYSSMTADEIEKDKALKNLEDNIKKKKNKFLNKYSRNKSGKFGQGVADKIDSMDELLYALYSQVMTGDMNFSDFKKVFNSSDDETRELDKKIVSNGRKMRGSRASDISKMSSSDVTSHEKDAAELMVVVNKMKPSDVSNIKTKDEAMIYMAKESNKNTKILQSLVSGLFSTMSSIAGGVFGKNGILRKFFSDDKLKEGIGKLKDKLFNEDTGLFAPLVRTFKDGVDYLKYSFTGKGYTNRKGKSFKDTTDSVFHNLTKGYSFVFENVMKSIFGDDYEGNDTYNKFFKWMGPKGKKGKGGEPQTEEEKYVQNSVFGGDGSDSNKIKSFQSTALAVTGEAEAKLVDAVDYTAEKIKTSGDNLSIALFGDETISQEKTKKKISESFMTKFKKNLPKMLTAGVVGGAVGLATSLGGGGIIGSLFLPNGIVGGVIAGMGLQIASRSEKFQNFIFGEKDESGNRAGGLISQKTVGAFKKLMPAMVGGAAIGALKGIVFGGTGSSLTRGSSGFLMNMLLPGGIIGGALLGVGASLLKNNEKFNKILFGEKTDADGNNKQSKGMISRGFARVQGAFEKSSHFVKGGLKGLGIGAIAGLTLSKLGVLGSAVSLGGPIGMGIAGLGIGIASQTQRFKELLFGTVEYDDDGKPIRRMKNGIMDQVRNMLVLNVFEPVKDKLQDSMTNFAYWAKDKIMYPFRLAFGPIIDSFKGLKDDIGEFIKDKFEILTDGIGNLLKAGVKKLFSPFTRLLGSVGKMLVGGLTKGLKLALSPLRLAIGTARLFTLPKRVREYTPFLKNIITTNTGKLRDKWDEEDPDKYGTGFSGFIRKAVGRTKDVRKAYTEGRDSWNEIQSKRGYNTFNWRNVGAEKSQDKKDLKNDAYAKKAWDRVNKLREKYAIEDDYKEIYWSDKTADKRRKAFIKAGATEDSVRTNEDLRLLMYDREAWKDKWNPNKWDGSTAIIPTDHIVSEEQKRTYDFQDNMEDWVKDIRDMMAEASGKHADSRTRKKNDDVNEKVGKRLRRSGLSALDLGLSEQQLFEYDDVPTHEFDNYRNSKYYTDRDFKGWYESNKARFSRKYKTYTSPQVNKADIHGAYTSSDKQQEKSSSEAIFTNDTNDLLSKNNQLMTTALEVSTGGAFDPRKGTISDNKADKLHTTSEEYENIYERGIFKGLKSIFKIRDKQVDRKKRAEIEAEESDRARSLGDKDKEAIFDSEFIEIDDDDDKKDKKSDSGGILGALGRFFGWFDKGGSWVKLLAGAGLTYLFQDQIKAVAKKVPDIISTYAPKIIDAIGGFITKFGPSLIKGATEVITTLIPTLVETSFTVVKSLFSSVFNSVKSSFGFGAADKTVDASEIPDLESKNIKYTFNGDGSVSVAGNRSYRDENDQLHKLSNSNFRAASAKLAMNLALKPERVAKLAVSSGAVTKTLVGATLSPFRLFGAGGKVVAQGGASFAGKAASFATNTITAPATVASAVLGSTSSKKKVVSWCLGILTKLGKLANNPKLTKIMSGTAFGRGIKKFTEFAISKLNTINDALATKLAAKITNGTAKATGKLALDATLIVPAIMGVYNIATGVFEAENLFGINKDAVDWKMRSISALMKFILGLGIGPFFDILLELLVDITGINIKRTLAVLLYDALSNVLGHEEDIKNLNENQELFKMEVENYNLANNTNISVDAYNQMKNAPWWKQAWNFITGKKSEDFSKYEVTKYRTPGIREDGSGNVSYDLVGRGPDPSIRSTSKRNSSSVGYGRGAITRPHNKYSVGYGGPAVLGVSQSDPRWSDYPLGTFPDGSISTMETGGCGPTALSMVSTALSNKTYDPLNMARYAQSNGYITDGGANEGLFTDGARDLGLKPSVVDKTGLKNAVQSGDPVILAGKSSSSKNSPYTDAGHIVVASDYNYTTKKAVISDPMIGYSQEVDISDLSSGMTHGWKYSSSNVGYGAGGDVLTKSAQLLAEYFIKSKEDKILKTEKTDIRRNDTEKIDNNSMFKDLLLRSVMIAPAMPGNTTLQKQVIPPAISRSSLEKEMKLITDVSRATNAGANILLPSLRNFILRSTTIGPAMPGNSALQKQLGATSSSVGLITSDSIDHTITDLKIMYSTGFSRNDDNVIKWNTVDFIINKKLTSNDVRNIMILFPNMNSWKYPILKSTYESYFGKSMLPTNGMKQLPNLSDYTKTPFEYKNEIIADYILNIHVGMVYRSPMTTSDLNKFYSKGFNSNSDGIVNWFDPNYYLNITADDIYNLANKNKSLLSTEYIIFRELFKYFFGRYEFRGDNPYATGEMINPSVDENVLLYLKSYTDAALILGLPSKDKNGYDFKNGIPFFYNKDDRWSSIKWKGSTIGERGSDITSLAMISSIFGNYIIPPDYIMNKWIPNYKNWWNSSSGLAGSEVFGPNGFNKMTATYSGDQPLQIRRLTTQTAIHEALKQRKPVYMSGYKYDGSIFGGTGDPNDIGRVFNSNNMNTVVGMYADDNLLAINDPSQDPSAYSLFNTSQLLNKIGHDMDINPVREAYMITGPDGSGITDNLINSKNSDGRKFKDLADYHGLDKFGALVSNFISVGANLIDSIFGGKPYESIKNYTIDNDKYEGDLSVISKNATSADNRVLASLGINKLLAGYPVYASEYESLPYTPGYLNQNSPFAFKGGISAAGWSHSSGGRSLTSQTSGFTNGYQGGISTAGRSHSSGGKKLNMGFGLGRKKKPIGYGEITNMDQLKDELELAYAAQMESGFNGTDYHYEKERLKQIRDAQRAGLENSEYGGIDINSYEGLGNLDLKNSRDLVKAAENVIYGHESSFRYNAINGDDNGSVSLGRIQWHADRAKELMRKIRARSVSTFDTTADRHGASALISHVRDVGSWGSYKMFKGTPIYKATSEILNTNVSKKVQDAQASNDVDKYIQIGRGYGLTDPKALIYFADFANQFGEHSKRLKKITSNAVRYGGTVDAMYRATEEYARTDNVVSTRLERRKKVYGSLKNTSINVGYGAGRGHKVDPSYWFADKSHTTNNSMSNSRMTRGSNSLISRSLNTRNSDIDRRTYQNSWYGYGQQIDPSLIIKKLDVAVKTDGVERKLDILIDVMRLYLEKDSSKSTNFNNTNVISYGNDNNHKRPVVVQPSSNKSMDYSGMNVRSIHDLIAKRS